MTVKLWIVTESYFVNDESCFVDDCYNFGSERVEVCKSKDEARKKLLEMFDARVKELKTSHRDCEQAEFDEDNLMYKVTPDYDDEADNISYCGSVSEADLDI